MPTENEPWVMDLKVMVSAVNPNTATGTPGR